MIWLALLPLTGVPAIGSEAVVATQSWLGAQGEPEIVDPNSSSAKSQPQSRRISLKFSGVLASVAEAGGQRATRLLLPSAGFSPDPAQPELPVYRRVLVVAPSTTVTCLAKVQATKEFALAESGLPVHLFPRQLPIRKVPGALQQAVPTSQAVKNVSARADLPVARLVELGIQRGKRLVLLEVFPVSYDADKGAVILREAIEVEIIRETTESIVKPPLIRRADTLSPSDGERGGVNAARARRLLIIAPPALATSLGSFVAHKAAQGWAVDSFTTEVAGSTAGSIQAFIRLRYASEATRPSDLLLVGDTDTIPAWPGKGAYLPDTDLYYACMDGASDWLPDMAIGRFPARTTQQLANMLSRSMSYETNVTKFSPFVSRAVFATSEENYTLTEGTHNYVIGRHMDPRGYVSQRLYRHTYSATTSQVTNAANSGCSLLAYSGHGSATAWLDPAVAVANVQGVINAFACPLVMSFACRTGSYRAYDECFAEAWLRRGDNAGAVAMLASSQDTYWEEDDVFEKCVFAAMFEDGALMLGDAVEAAKARYLAFYGTSSETLQYFEQYNIFGDPTLALAVRDGQSNGDIVRALRQLPASSLNSNELFTVTVEVAVTNPGPSGLAFVEKLPTGWVVTNATWKGVPMSPTNSGGGYRWFFGTNPPVSSGILSYQTRAAGGLGATLAITGSLLYGTNTVPVLGDVEVHILPIMDTDHDGMADDWEIRYGLSTTNAVDAALDPDGDGMSNLQEYLADTIPTNRASALRITSLGWSNGLPRIQWQGGIGATQYLERCIPLGGASSWTPLSVSLPPTPVTNTFVDTNAPGGNGVFYRLRALR